LKTRFDILTNRERVYVEIGGTAKKIEPEPIVLCDRYNPISCKQRDCNHKIKHKLMGTCMGRCQDKAVTCVPQERF
jgi:hypothetical protein